MKIEIVRQATVGRRESTTMTLRTMSFSMVIVFSLILSISSVCAFARCDQGERFDFITHTTPFFFLEIWRIDHPSPCQREWQYPDITFSPGDSVSVTAGGCVQTGGVGRTWKRYVNPSGPDSDRLYHGLIRLPGMIGLPRIQDFLSDTGGSWTIPNDLADLTLHLGYEDDGYGDNGYWNHDDGTEGQCQEDRDGGPAWIELLVFHPF